MRTFLLPLVALGLFSLEALHAAEPAFLALGAPATARQWAGLSRDGGNWKIPGSVTFEVPAGPKGWWNRGFRREHDGTVNGLPYAGLVIALKKDRPEPLELTVRVSIPTLPDRQDFVAASTATLRVNGAGERRLFVPWSAFDFQQAQPAFLKFIQKVELTAKYADGQPGVITLSRVELSRGEAVAFDADVRSHALAAAGATSYPVTIFNCTDAPQSVALSIQKRGWEAMPARVEPAALDLAPGASGQATVTVEMPENIPPGGRETQTLRAVADGQSVATLDFTTARDVAHPYLLHTAARWDEVRDKVRKYDWAKQAQQEYLARADKWTVPEVAKFAAPPSDGLGDYLFETNNEGGALACGIAWQLTGDKKYAEKVALFLRRLSDPVTGYSRTLRGSNQGLVQEGHFFQHIVQANDMILDAGVLTAADRAQIEKTYRLFLGTMDFEMSTGNISNWNMAECAGALNASLLIGDLERAMRFYSGPNGVLDQLGKGVMDDGWWYECSISYNGWMASLGTEMAMALEPWGINLRTMRIPNAWTKNYGLVPWASQPGLFGMSFEKWGPVTRPYVKITDLWDGFLPFVDYRGIIFGANDSDEKQISGNLYELAYYANRDPKYAAMIKYGGKRDLLWGVPELPKDTPELFRASAAADNAGMVVLRSQTPDRPQREQIQAVLKYGTHGGYHGHFDRASLLSIMRYGRSFFHPEMVWYGYGSFMYKFYCQTSISKNMVVVDDKMQEPVESRRLLFHSGPMLQASAVETKARWSYPPFAGGAGMVGGGGGAPPTLEEFTWSQSRYLPVPKEIPPANVVTGFTEPVLQRRLLAVTDDYVVVADYLRSEREHTFDNLFQIKGFRGITAPEAKLVLHTAQLDSDPLGNAQLITDCDWYDVKGPALAKFDMTFGAGAVSDGLGVRNEAGPLAMDVYSAWPEQREMMVGNAPVNSKGNGRKVEYRVTADGAEVAKGRFGAWVIGEGIVDVPVAGKSTVELAVTTAAKRDAKTLFWAAPRVVTADGKEVAVPASAITYVNTEPAPAAGEDYDGGPIKIAGNAVAAALPAEPVDLTKPALVRIDLTKLGAVRLRASVGGDYPVGDESAARKTFAIRTTGKEARFLTVIESREAAPVVKSVTAPNANELLVTLQDGRQQRITIKGLDAAGESTPTVTIEERRDGKVVRTESTNAPN